MLRIPQNFSKDAITRALLEVVSRIPHSLELASASPQSRARALARAASLKTAALSGALALPPGPFGMMTILPDLVMIWRVQEKMVADIAAVFGKTSSLGREAMVYCLFKHGGAALVRDLVVRVGERVIIRRAAVEILTKTLQKVGLRVSERLVGRALSRWVPLIGSVGVGAYAYYDTNQVAANAVALFSQPIEIEPVFDLENSKIPPLLNEPGLN